MVVDEAMGALDTASRASGAAEPAMTPDGTTDRRVDDHRCALELRGVTKVFGSTVALRNVSLKFGVGTVHGLVGENGSGKSTLVKLVTGLHGPDAGAITSPMRADRVPSRRVSVGSVFQDGTLIDELTLEENIRLIATRTEGGAHKISGILKALRSYGIPVAGRRPVADLSNSVRRVAEIIAVASLETDILLFDEATSVLDERQVAVFDEIVRLATRRGACVIIVSHRLREVLATCDDISVLRDGQVVWAGASDQVDEPKLVEAMAGHEVAAFTKASRDAAGDDSATALTARGLSLGDAAFDVTVRRGEIVGIGGPAGHGQGELLRTLGGERCHSGASMLSISDRVVGSVPEASRAGAVIVSSDRRRESLFQGLSIRENYGLSLVGRIARRWWIVRAVEEARVRAHTREHGLAFGSIEQPAESLSGGNQQKLAIGRALVRSPAVLLVEAPTEGVDVRSRLDIYRRLEEAADSGVAVAFTSTDASELASLADRVLVMVDRRVVAELSGDELNETNIVRAFASAMKESGGGAERDPARRVSDATKAGGLADWVRARLLWSRGVHRSEFATVAFLAAFLVLVWIYGTAQHSSFLSSHNVDGVSLVAAPIIFGAFAEFVVIMVGEIDISIAGMMGLVLVVLSFVPGQSWPVLLVLALLMGVAMGVINGLIVIGSGANAVIITIAMLSVYEGIGLYLRPSPAGSIATGAVSIGEAAVANIVVWTLVAVAIAIVADVAIRRSKWGLKLRAVGFDRDRAQRLGVVSVRVRLGAFALSGAFAGWAGFLLAAQTGTGDATVGSSYLLIAIAVPVIGGASLLGGRGTMIGCVMAGVILASIESVVSFANLPNGYYLVAVGVLTLLALAISLTRRRSGRRREYGEVQARTPGEA